MVATFAELGLDEQIVQAVTELGYEEPTPIQEQTIRLLLEGSDVIAQAQTGTGKTAAFALPILEKLDPAVRSPQALVLTPTRELAVQVAEAFQSYSKYRRVSILPVYGGQPIDRQLRALERGVQVVVGTPGRVLDHIRRKTLKLADVRIVVLDEADEMLNMGFIEDIETILKETAEGRQTALFSATMPGPIASLAKKYIREAKRIKIEAEHLTVDQIRQMYYEVGKRDKFEMLARILDYEQPTSALIFCRTKLEVDSLGQRLNARGYAAETLHGDLNQMQRDRVMGRFRANQIDLLIATDVAARGLDVEQISHVINYDMPHDSESYVHRIGRTGRAGRTGIAVSLVTPRERYLLQMIQRSTGATIHKMRLPTLGDVVTRRIERFKETLRETLASDGLEPFLQVADELSEEFTPRDLAAAAFKLIIGATTDDSEDKLAEPEDRPEDSRPRKAYDRERTGGKRKEPSRIGPEKGMTRLYIDIGREGNVRPSDIVGAIANEADIPGRSIGAIEIYDYFTLVDVPTGDAKKVLRALKDTRIRNRRVTVDIAKPPKNTEVQP
jgi:ATP-dependent RNA helicase DeaD